MGQQALKKRVIGTLVLFLLVVGGIFATTQTALAQFISGGRSYVFDGVVTSVSSSTVTVQTDSTSPITLARNRPSHVTGGTLAIGDAVHVIANQNSNNSFHAELIRITSTGASGYGSSGIVLLNNSVVVSNTGGVLTVNHNGVIVRFTVNSSTHFIGRGTLSAGNHVFILGQDNGTSFVARQVIKF
jgi:hypothetical protein